MRLESQGGDDDLCQSRRRSGVAPRSPVSAGAATGPRAFDAVAWARNEHVHPKIETRDTYSHDMWVQAYMVAGEWITIATLRRLGYMGLHRSRLGHLLKTDLDLHPIPPITSAPHLASDQFPSSIVGANPNEASVSQ